MKGHNPLWCQRLEWYSWTDSATSARITGPRDSRRGQYQPIETAREDMKKNLHPELHLVTAVCACGSTFETHSTKKELRLEICSACHPFYTGKQKLVDTGGRVERFQRRAAKRRRG